MDQYCIRMLHFVDLQCPGRLQMQMVRYAFKMLPEIQEKINYSLKYLCTSRMTQMCQTRISLSRLSSRLSTLCSNNHNEESLHLII